MNFAFIMCLAFGRIEKSDKAKNGSILRLLRQLFLWVVLLG